MKVAADENLFEPIIDYLRELGHDVFSIRNTSHSGISDDEIYTLACKEKRVIMTMNKKFYQNIRERDVEGNLVIIIPEEQRYDRILKISWY